MSSVAKESAELLEIPPSIDCLHRLFEHQADATPAAIAVHDKDHALGYSQLDKAANQFARYLRREGIGRGDFVGLYCGRSVGAIISMLGILKAGAAYVPLDAQWPDERIDGILKDAGVGHLVADDCLVERASKTSVTRIIVHNNPEVQERIDALPETRLQPSDRDATGDDLCYIIYTSGTTGKPKGIMTEHRNVVSFTRAFRTTCEMTPDDRVYHGFSLTFDGSVEEIWMAFSSGAELVIGPPNIAQLGEETAAYMNDYEVTFFSTVPTFLAMLPQQISSLRLIVVSGEACPASLINQWVRPGVRMLNVYGPTECTVNTTAWDCKPDQEVSIGNPLLGYTTYILDESMRPVGEGESGELFIGGVGLARGYLGREELTERSFVDNPFLKEDSSPKLYRTGDLVRLNDRGELMFIGRIDSQVKVRGYRIELGEIEAVLREHSRIDAAAVKVVDRDGLQSLAAFVVPATTDCATCKQVSHLTDGDRADVRAHLCTRLPAYMVPSLLDEIDVLPRLTSGKLDVKRLPEPQTPLVNETTCVVAPTTETEHILLDVWTRVFDREGSTISANDDFFLDLGGYSLLAASSVSQVRGTHDLDVAIRDVYQFPTISMLAAELDSRAARKEREQSQDSLGESRRDRKRRSSKEVFDSVSPITRTAVTIAQFAFALLIYGTLLLPVAVAAGIGISMYSGVLPIGSGIAMLAVVTLAWYPIQIMISVAAKWLIVGKYRTGSYPIWGWYFLRFWAVGQFQAISGIGLLAGTPLMSLYYRLMGAKIGRGCILDTPACAAFDLVTIGDESCVGAESHLLGYRIEDGMVHFGSIDIGHRCFVGIHSVLALNTRMEDDSRIGDLSLVEDGRVLPTGESFQGSPAKPAQLELGADAAPHTSTRPWFYGFLHFALAEAIILFVYLSTVPFIVGQIAIFHRFGTAGALASSFLLIPVYVIWFCLLVVAAKRIVLAKMEPGVYAVETVFYLRKWFADSLVALTRIYMKPVYTTIFLPAWLRMLGAKVGRRAEVSTVSQITPDLVEIGDESFFADGSMVGGRHFHRGSVELARNQVGRRSFVGNNAILSIGSDLGDESLLGVLSSPPVDHATTPDESEWLGSPSFCLPFRQKVEGFADSTTYQPTKWLYFVRTLIDSFRVVTPFVILNLGGIGLVAYLAIASQYASWWQVALTTPIASMVIAIAMALCVVLLKRLIMGTFKPVIKPLWCTYVWWNEAINGAYESVGAPVLLPLQGTPFFNMYLRAMGCRIGRHSYIGTTLFSEFDLVDIGDYAALNFGVVVQNHLFEDRIMKSSDIFVGNQCSIGNHSVVLYDTDIHDSTVIGPLSLLMKGETLAAGTDWIGAPTSQAIST